MAEELIEIGSYCLISWNVGIADSDFHPIDPAQRRQDALALAPFYKDRPPRPPIRTAPVRIADNVWIGMNAVILKGVTIGENCGRRGWIGGFEKRRRQHGRCGESSRGG